MLASGADAFARRHDRGAALPQGRVVGERRAAADGEAGSSPGAHRVLGRLPPELPADEGYEGPSCKATYRMDEAKRTVDTAQMLFDL